MRKATLIKKDSPARAQLAQARKSRKVREPKPEPVRSALEVTTEWLKKRKEEGPTARESFAALFTNSDPQSA